MNPVMVFSDPIEKGGTVELVCGTPGADTQVQTNLQIITSIYDYGLNDKSMAVDTYLNFIDLYPKSIFYDIIRLRLRELAL